MIRLHGQIMNWYLLFGISFAIIACTMLGVTASEHHQWQSSSNVLIDLIISGVGLLFTALLLLMLSRNWTLCTIISLALSTSTFIASSATGAYWIPDVHGRLCEMLWVYIGLSIFICTVLVLSWLNHLCCKRNG